MAGRQGPTVPGRVGSVSIGRAKRAEKDAASARVIADQRSAAAAPSPAPSTNDPNITFVVTGKAYGADRWLTPSRTWSTQAADAARFVLRRTPTNAQRLLIDGRCHDMYGGLRKWLELRQAETDAWLSLLAKYDVLLWPKDGPPRPDQNSADGARAYELAVDAAFREDHSILAEGLREMRSVRRRVEFMAAWPVLAIQVPPGWASLDDLPDDPPDLVIWLIDAHDRALATERENRGN